MRTDLTGLTPIICDRATFLHLRHLTSTFSVISLFQLPCRAAVPVPTKCWFSAGLGSVVSQRSLFSYVQMLSSQKSKCQTRGGGKKTRKSDDSWHVEHPSSAGKDVWGFFFFPHCVYACVFTCEKCNKSWSVLTKRTVVLRCPGGLYHAQCRHQSIDAWQVMSHFPCPERRSHLYGDDYR